MTRLFYGSEQFARHDSLGRSRSDSSFKVLSSRLQKTPSFHVFGTACSSFCFGSGYRSLALLFTAG